MFHPAGGPRSPTFAPIVRIPPKSDNPSGAGEPPLVRSSCSLKPTLHLSRGELPALSSATVSAMIVTIDGPGGTGKSTVSRVVAHRAGLPHLDTGAFYRAATLAVLEAGVDPANAERVNGIVEDLVMGQEEGHMFLGGRDVSSEIRSDEVTSAVSAVSAHPAVRQKLVDMQRSWAERHENRGVVEGRDIGSVVFPDAELKVYLDASAQVRAQRRARETGEDIDEVLADLNRRDRLDSTRLASPLTVPDDAVVVDTSELGFDEVVHRLLGLIEQKS